MLLVWGCVTCAMGQVRQSASFEIPLSENENTFSDVSSLEENGLILYRSVTTKETHKPGVEIIRLDTALQVIWRGVIPLENPRIIFLVTHRANEFHILLQDPQNPFRNFEILTFFFNTSQYAIHKINNLIPFIPKQFAVTEKAAFLGGVYNYRPLVLYVDFATAHSKVLPGFLNQPGEINQLRVYEDGAVDVVIVSDNIERRMCLWIRNYTAEGELIKTTQLDPGEGKHFIFGQSIKTGQDEQVVAGVYGRHREFSRGIFVARINISGEYEVNYYNFGDLQNFFSYMKAKREQRVKERIQRRKIRGKKLRFNYRFLVQGLLPYKDNYLLIGEAFYPTYTSSYTNTYRSNMVFDGYRFTHAAVICFTKNGKLLWDNSFEINDAKSFTLRPFVRVHTAENHLTLLYAFQNAIRSKIIANDRVVEGKSVEELGTTSSTEMVKKDEHDWNILEYWYGENFYTYGTRHLQSKTNRYQFARKVFFMTKVVYR
jgi:hypothetical protein